MDSGGNGDLGQLVIERVIGELEVVLGGVTLQDLQMEESSALDHELTQKNA